MEEKTLFRIALSSSIFGIILLFISIQLYEVELFNINEINLDDYVKVIGKKEVVFSKDNFCIMKIEDQTGKIDAICFEDCLLCEDIIVEGKVENYKGNLQIVIDKQTCA